MKFFADHVDIYLDGHRLEARGNVKLGPEQTHRRRARRVRPRDRTGVFYDASGMALGDLVDTSMFATQDPDVFFCGRASRSSAQQVQNRRGAFTHLRAAHAAVGDSPQRGHQARRLRLRQEHGLPGQGRAGVYLPILYYPMQEDERATGFLLPTYGTSTYRGQALSNGFFWAMRAARTRR